MQDFFENPFISTFNEMALTEDDLTKIEQYQEIYADKPENYLLREIIETKNMVSENVLKQHINNLNLMSQMEGFVSREQKNKIEYLKNLLESDTTVYRRRGRRMPDVQEQSFVSGSSLLLWFLLLSVIWRRPFIYR